MGGLQLLSQYSYVPFLFHYDITTKQVTDLQLGDVALEIGSANNDGEGRAIGNNKFVTCGRDKNFKLAAFYYNGNKWNTTEFDGDFYNCSMSVSGNNSVRVDARVNIASSDSNVWVFFTK